MRCADSGTEPSSVRFQECDKPVLGAAAPGRRRAARGRPQKEDCLSARTLPPTDGTGRRTRRRRHHLAAGQGLLQVACRVLRARPNREWPGCEVSAVVKCDCRLDGRDCEIEVRRALPSDESVVVAILDHGQEEVYAMCTPTAESELSCASGATCPRSPSLPERPFPSAWLVSSITVRAVGSG